MPIIWVSAISIWIIIIVRRIIKRVIKQVVVAKFIFRPNMNFTACDFEACIGAAADFLSLKTDNGAGYCDASILAIDFGIQKALI